MCMLRYCLCANSWYECFLSGNTDNLDLLQYLRSSSVVLSGKLPAGLLDTGVHWRPLDVPWSLTRSVCDLFS